MNHTCYAVIMGRKPGIYKTWDEVLEQTRGFMGASFKKCCNREEALKVMGISNERGFKELEVRQAELLSERLNLSSIYVDGSFDSKANIYAYGIKVVERGEVVYQDSGAEQNVEIGLTMGSLAAELKASMKALQYAANYNKRNIIIYYDNLMIHRLLDGSTSPKNKYQQQYIDFARSLIEKHHIRVDFSKVKAHNGNKYNESVDKLAKQAMKEKRSEIRGYPSIDDLSAMDRTIVLSLYYKNIQHYKNCGCNFKTVKKRMNEIVSSTLSQSQEKGISIDKEQIENYVNQNEQYIKAKFKKFKPLNKPKSKAKKKKDYFVEYTLKEKTMLTCWCHQFIFEYKEMNFNFNKVIRNLSVIADKVVNRASKEKIKILRSRIMSYIMENYDTFKKKYEEYQGNPNRKKTVAIDLVDKSKNDITKTNRNNWGSHIDELNAKEKTTVSNVGYGLVFTYLNAGNKLKLTTKKKKQYVNEFSKKLVMEASEKGINISIQSAKDFYKNKIERINKTYKKNLNNRLRSIVV